MVRFLVIENITPETDNYTSLMIKAWSNCRKESVRKMYNLKLSLLLSITLKSKICS